MYKYLVEYLDINLTVIKCFNQNDTNTNINNYHLPESDFIIIIDDRHFVHRNMSHINYYKKNNKFMIITINNNNFFNICENLAIYFDPVCDTNKLNTMYMDYGHDANLLYQNNSNTELVNVVIYGSSDASNIINNFAEKGNNFSINQITSNQTSIIGWPIDIFVVIVPKSLTKLVTQF